MKNSHEMQLKTMSKDPWGDTMKTQTQTYTVHGPYCDVNLRGRKTENGMILTYDYNHDDKEFKGELSIPNHVVPHLYHVTNENRKCTLTFPVSTYETLTIQKDYGVLLLIYENKEGPNMIIKTIPISTGEEHFLHALIRQLYPTKKGNWNY